MPGLKKAGVANHLLSLCEGLIGRGWEVHVAYLRGPAEMEREFEQAGCTVSCIGIERTMDPIGLARLIRYITKNDFDIIHTHLFRGDVYGSIAGILTSNTPIISTKHNNAPYLESLPYRWLHSLTAAISDEIITISDFLKDFHSENTFSREEKFTTIHYGLDLKPFQQVNQDDVREIRSTLPDDSQILIGTVCRLVNVKGIDILLDSLPRVIDANPQVHLLIVGDGPNREELERQCHTLGLENNVTFAGFRSDIPELMHAFDLFVLPSRREGFGLVLLEAMAAGTPIVATRTSAIPEVVVDNETGKLATVGDSEDLSEKIISTINNPNTMENMGQAGLERVENSFTMEETVSNTEILYKKYINA
ncbi:glycosyltransferase [Halovenus sp. HT40]|uniref:glycosyltransferase n=1 Tax=Halovenus sp. HT40 TaxID=3126691 RepID=UPI00300E751D